MTAKPNRGLIATKLFYYITNCYCILCDLKAATLATLVALYAWLHATQATSAGRIGISVPFI